MVKLVLTIIDETGIHARPATLLVNKAGSFQSDITVDFDGKSANLKSIMGVMSLGIPVNAKITIKAEGSDEQEAIDTIYEVLKKEGIAIKN